MMMRTNSKYYQTLLCCLYLPLFGFANGTENTLRLMYQAIFFASIIVVVGVVINILNVFIINRALNVLAIFFTVIFLLMSFTVRDILVPPFDSYLLMAQLFVGLLWCWRFYRIKQRQQ